MKRKRFIFITLIAYIIFIFFLAVLSRESIKDTVKLDLFWGYRQPKGYTSRDNLLNIVCFIPIGLLVGLCSDKYRIVKAILFGLLVSISIEFSQLIWHRGVFDVDDLFNNVLGTLIGGLIVVLFVMRLKRKAIDNRKDGTVSIGDS